MAYTQTDLANIQTAIAKGILRARIGEEEITYRSLAEMLRIEERIKAALGVKVAARLKQVQTVSGWR